MAKNTALSTEWDRVADYCMPAETNDPARPDINTAQLLQPDVVRSTRGLPGLSYVHADGITRGVQGR